MPRPAVTTSHQRCSIFSYQTTQQHHANTYLKRKMSPAMHHYLKRSNSSFFDMQHALPYLVRHTLTYTQCFACDAGDVTYNALARVTNQITYQLVSDIRLHSINAATPAAPSNYQTTRCHHVAHASSCQTTRQHQSTFKLPNHTMSSRCCTYFTVTSPLATSS